MRTTGRQRPPRAIEPWPFVGMAGMAAALFLYAVSGLFAPGWGVVVLLAAWSALFALCCAWWTRHPRRLPFVAAGTVLLWFVAIAAGGLWLGWTA